MLIYTDGSTFPTHRFYFLDDKNLYSYTDIKNFIYVIDENKVKENIIRAINIQEMQHLFEYLILNNLRLTFNKEYSKILDSEIQSTSIVNKTNFLYLLNLKIDLK